MAVANLNKIIQNKKVLRGAIGIQPAFNIEYIRGIDAMTYSQLFQVFRAIERKARPELYAPIIRYRIAVLNAVLTKLAVLIKSAKVNAPEFLAELKQAYKDLALVRFNLIKYQKTDKDTYLVKAIKLVQPVL